MKENDLVVLRETHLEKVRVHSRACLLRRMGFIQGGNLNVEFTERSLRYLCGGS